MREPRSPREEILCELFAEVLGVPAWGSTTTSSIWEGTPAGAAAALPDPVGPGEGFEIRDLFAEPTVAGLARLTGAARPH
ncbi:hypothetical protein NKH18_15695 [Streptomyces sp. M10(2022)]